MEDINIILRDSEHASENDAKENIEDGNVALYPNTTGSLSYINDMITLAGVQEWDITPGNIKVSVEFVSADEYDPDNPPTGIVYFRDGSYFKVVLQEYWSTSLVPTLDNIGYLSYFGIKDPTTGIITEVASTGVSGLPGYKRVYIWPTKPPQQWSYFDYNYLPGDTFTLYLGWWNDANPKMRAFFVPEYVHNNKWAIDAEWETLSANVLSSGAINPVYNTTENQHLVMDFLAGQRAKGVDYPGDPTGAEGGDGDFLDDWNDEVLGGQLTTIDICNLGFVKLYAPSEADIRALADWLWSSDFDVNVKKNFISPFDNIVNLGIVPISPDAENANIIIGNLDSGIASQKVKPGKFQDELDCGTVHIKPYWRGFLDYDCIFTIWLPFVGFRSLRTDDIMDADVNVLYRYSILTGDFVVEIKAVKNSKTRVLYTFNGNFMTSIPISGANFLSMYNQRAAATAESVNNWISSAKQIAGGDLISGIAGFITGQDMAQRKYDAAKPEYARGGNFGGSGGLYATRYPYIIRTKPISTNPKQYKHLQGIPSQVDAILSNISGYAEVDSIEIAFDCRDDEKDEIIKLLKSGVYL